MAQAIYQGRTNNHINWVMVDATDFATPESALSAATKIKIYGQLRSATGTNFITSGTGSLTNDIDHVGASATGQYHIALAKADISDASAAFYDAYIVTLSATGAAYQTLILEGIKADGSYVSNVLSYLSNVVSGLSNYASNASGILSDILSQTLLATSAASDAASAAQQGNSRVLLVQSRLSDLDSRLVSDLSDILSQVVLATSAASDAASAAQQANSRALVIQSQVSDIYSLLSDVSSDLGVMSGILSDAYSAIIVVQSAASDAASAAQQANSRVLVTQSLASDAHSAAVAALSTASDIYSLLTANRAEPGQGAPAATTDPLAKIDYLYKAWRNRTYQSTTKYRLYGDDGTTIDQSAAAADDGATSFVRAEIGTGA